MSYLWLFIALVIGIAALYLSERFFKKTGLFIFSAFAVVLANVQSSMLADLNGWTFACGSGLFIVLLFAFILTLSKYGKKDAIVFGIIAITASLFSGVMNLFTTAASIGWHAESFRITAGNIIAMGCSFSLAFILYNVLIKFNKYLAISIAMIAAIIVDVVLFNLIALPLNDYFTLLYQNIVLKIAIAAIIMLLFIPYEIFCNKKKQTDITNEKTN